MKMEHNTLEAQNKRKCLAVIKRMQDYRRRIYDETKHDLMLKKDRNRKKVANKLAKDTETRYSEDIQKRREKEKLKKRAQRAAKKQQKLNNDVVK